MIAPQIPTPTPPVPFFTFPNDVSSGAATGTHVRRRRRGGLIVDLDDTLYPREQFVLSGLAAVARYIAAMNSSHADLYTPRNKERISGDAALATLIEAYDHNERGRELQALCRRFDLSPDVIPELVTAFRAHRPSLWLRPGVVDTLQRLRRDGWRIVILTNGLPAVQASKVAALEVARFVDGVLYAEQFAPGGKPAPATFQAALAQLNLPARSCICVGDDPVCDIRGAHAAGLRTIRIAGADVTVRSRDEADAVVDRFEDVPSAAHALLNLVNVDVA
jgi:putative hydrolase of the HAD superfamily